MANTQTPETIHERAGYKLPAGWRTWPTYRLEQLADDLNTKGEYYAAEDVEAELDERASDMDYHDDTPSLQDAGYELGSYQS